MVSWTAAAPAIGAAFLASLVEVVEAFTIVLAAATVRGWRPALLGAISGLVALALIVALAGPALAQVPLRPLQLLIGILLLLFGLRWLRKAVLRSAGIIPLHDEDLAFRDGTRQLAARAPGRAVRPEWLATVAAFKAVLLEGLEVVFIVIAVGAGNGLLVPASLGAVAACLVVVGMGALVRQPLSRVPENLLKFVVGVLLSSFGVFWAGEGLGIDWPGGDFAVPGFAVLFLVVSIGLSRLATRRPRAPVP